MTFDEEIRGLIAAKTKEIRDAQDAIKKEYDSKVATISERVERMEQARDERNTDETIKQLATELIELSKKDQTNRHVDLAPAPDYTMRAIRKVMETCETPKQIRAVHDHILAHRPQDDKMRRYQELSVRLSFIGAGMNRGLRDNPREDVWHPAMARNLDLKLMWSEYCELRKEYFGEQIVQRAFDTADSSDWVPSLMSAELLRYLEITGTLLPNIKTVPMGSATWKYPITTGIDKARYVPEATAYPSAVPAYGQNPAYKAASPIGGVTFSAKKIRAHMGYSAEMDEDSIVAFSAWATPEIASCARRGIEDAIINGDTDTPKIDSDIDLSPDGTDGTWSARVAWKGLRSFALATSAMYDAANAALDTTKLNNTIKKMERYAVNVNDTIWLFGIKGYLDLIDMDQFMTFDKIGSRATIITGSVGILFGRSVIVNEFVREDTNEGGQYDGTIKDRTVGIIYDRSRMALGNWRGMTNERERLAFFDQNIVYAWWRGDFQKLVKSTETTEAVVYNIPT
jgi:hypothetical protein